MPGRAYRLPPKFFHLALLLGLLGGLAAGLWLGGSAVHAQSGLPTKPDIHTVTGLHQGLRVYWYEPSEDGGSPLTGYDVHYRASGTKTWTDAGHAGLTQPAAISGLRFGTTYEVQVRAVNANGAGPWSAAESRRTLSNDGRPDPPLPPTLEAGNGQVEVAWTAPNYTGGRAITGYRVLYTTDAAATWRSWRPGGNRLIAGAAATITGLDDGVTVGVVVAALNARGQGRYSSPIAEAEPMQAAAPPPTPGAPRVISRGASMEVYWSSLSAAPPVTGYELQYQAIAWNASVWPETWTAVVAGLDADAVFYWHEELDPDRRYRYRVRAVNHIGAGDWSPVSPEAGAQPRPGVPALRAQTAASGSVKLSWSKGPASVTLWEYRWRRADGAFGRWVRIAGSGAETTEHLVSGLAEDTRYEFVLHSYNAAGAGSSSAWVGAVAGLPPTKPRVSLWYGDYDASGGATARGSYAFLSDARDLTSGITNFASAPTAAALLVNVEGYGGRDYADFLDGVVVGDTFTWRHTARCWFAYRVTGLKSDPPAPARKMFAIKLTVQDSCAVPIQDPGPGSFDVIEWGPPPSEPVIGPDGIRVFPDRYPVAGGHTYRLTENGYGISWIVVDVPAGMQLIQLGASEEFGGYITVFLRDLASGAMLALDYDTGEEVGRYIPLRYSAASKVSAQFDAIAASARVQRRP